MRKKAASPNASNRQPRPSRSCIFCGASGSLSREHMWPQWTHPYFDKRRVDPHTPRLNPSTKWAVAQKAGKPELHLQASQDTVQGYIQNKTFPIVCVSCNGGWMSVLEERMSKFGRSLIEGKAIDLDRSEVACLASWSSLRTMIMEFYNRDLIVTSPQQRRELYRTKRPPAGSQIWVGRYEGTEWHNRASHNAMGVATPDGAHLLNDQPLNTQTTTIVCGQLLLYVHTTTLPTLSVDIWGGPVLGLLKPIWPYTRALKWPLAEVVDDDAAYAISDGLVRDGWARTADAIRSTPLL